SRVLSLIWRASSDCPCRSNSSEIAVETGTSRFVHTGIRCPHHNRSEEHTSELQSRGQLVCRHLLEKKKDAQHALQPPADVTIATETAIPVHVSPSSPQADIAR